MTKSRPTSTTSEAEVRSSTSTPPKDVVEIGGGGGGSDDQVPGSSAPPTNPPPPPTVLPSDATTSSRVTADDDVAAADDDGADAASPSAFARPSSHQSRRRPPARPSTLPGAVRVPGPGIGAPPPPDLTRASNDVSEIGVPTPAGTGTDAEADHHAHNTPLEGYVVPENQPPGGRRSSAEHVSASVVGASLPPLLEESAVRGEEEQTNNNSSSSTGGGKWSRAAKKKAYFLAGAVAVAVAGIVAGAVAGAVVGTRNKNNPSSSSTSADSNQEETVTTTTEPPRSERYQQLRAAILAAIPDAARREGTVQALQNASSAQGRALAWLEKEDQFLVDPSSESESLAVVQRFVLAAVYYSVGGENWVNDANFLSNVSECEWSREEEDPGNYELFQFVGTNCSGEEIGVITTLWLANNRLVGTLPQELTMLTGLTDLAFTGNFVGGTIPLGLPRGLEYLSLDTNELSGGVPMEIWNMTNLKQLWLSDNSNLGGGGTIATEIGQLLNLEAITLDNGNFTGRIPSQLGSLGALWLVGLSGNSLTGTIPTELGMLSSLEILYVDKNQLTGTVPDSVCALREAGTLKEIVIFSPRVPGNLELKCDCCDRQVCSTTVPCEENWFCNFDLGETGFCEACGVDIGATDDYCGLQGLTSSVGDQECRKVCYAA